MRAIQVFRWTYPPTGGAPFQQSQLLRIPENQIDGAYSLMMGAWRAFPNRLPPPKIVDAPPEPPPMPSGPTPGFLPPGVSQLIPPDVVIERNLCPDCVSQVMFVEMPQPIEHGPTLFGAVTLHAPTCPAYAQMVYQHTKGTDQ